MRHVILATFCIAALAGCEPRTATLTFTPATLKNCGANSAPSTVTIHWDATQAKTKHGVKLWISNRKTPRRQGIFGGDPGTLWLQGAETGTSQTGRWVYPGTTFIVTDAKNGDTLASVKVPSAPCN
jgi:hypothetical protein